MLNQAQKRIAAFEGLPNEERLCQILGVDFGRFNSGP